MPPKQNLLNQRFGKLSVIAEAETAKKVTYWACVCDCGKETTVRAYSLTSGHTASCGCMMHRPKHGLCGSPVWMSWQAMLSRCNDVRGKDYPRYGGRGITVCSSWSDFRNFLEDMGDRPPKHSLDRIDNNLGYFKENCRWADPKTQSNNRRSNKLMTVGCCSLQISEWSKELSMPTKLIYARLNRGWSPEKTISTPVQTQQRRIKAAA